MDYLLSRENQSGNCRMADLVASLKSLVAFQSASWRMADDFKKLTRTAQGLMH